VVKNLDDTLNISYKILDQKNYVNQSNQYTLINKPLFNEHFIRINREHFDQSRYEIELTAEKNGKKITMRKLFSFFWTSAPDSPKDLDIALEQMRYIIDADSIGWALKQNHEEKLGYFERFWERMDPNPDTEKNELLNEYYGRVNFTIQNFSTMNIDGWRTDRGRIFIKFGQPEDIERYPFEMHRYPFEIWRYYSLRKIFLFEDRTGFGEYYLNPAYYNEEYN
jgi:GWxTD domain-containing protein